MYKKKSSGWSQHTDFMALDILCLEITMISGALLHAPWRTLAHSFTFWSLCLGAGIVDLMVMVLMDAYHSIIRRDAYRELRGVLSQTVYVTMGLLAFIFLMRTDGVDTINVLIPTMPFYVVLCFSMRVLWKEYLRKRLHLKNRTGMLVVAGKDRLRSVITELVNHNYRSYRFVGAALLEEEADTAAVKSSAFFMLRLSKALPYYARG